MLSGRNISKKRLTYYNDFSVKYINPCRPNHENAPEDANLEICTDRECHCYKKKIVNFVITLESKIGHPWVRHIKNNLCFAIDGIKGQTLYLERGYTYNFFFRFDNIQNIERRHFFIFTNDPLGGSSTNMIKVPVASTETYPVGFGQTISLFVNDTIPKVFFYQSLCDTCMGGIIIVNDPVTCSCTKECNKSETGPTCNNNDSPTIV